MKTEKEVEILEKFIGQLQGLYSEIALLAKKSPNDGLNTFKLRFVNKVLDSGNKILTDRYTPFEDFRQFSEEDLPTNSDVTMILSQYIEQTERFRSDNIVIDRQQWQYVVNGAPSGISASPPAKVGPGRK